MGEIEDTMEMITDHLKKSLEYVEAGLYSAAEEHLSRAKDLVLSNENYGSTHREVLLRSIDMQIVLCIRLYNLSTSNDSDR